MRLAYGGSCHFQQYFSHIVAAGFIGGEIREYPVKTTNLSEVTDSFINNSNTQFQIEQNIKYDTTNVY
jgi:hypothetical protein